MTRLILINIILFIVFILAFATGAFFLSSAAIAGYQILSTIIYVFIALLHLAINYALLRKRQLGQLKPLLLSSIVIVAAYIINLFLYK